MRIVVTGGGGYIGRHIVARLRDRGDEVTVVGRHTYPAVEALGARCVQADLGAEGVDLAPVFEVHDAVIHTAAKPPYFAPRDAFWGTNVLGTRAVIDGCRRAGVQRLVFTSTPSVVFDGTACEGRSEAECPYPSQWENAYAETKAIAEQEVLAANDAALATTALRPRLVYGPEEPHMLPRVWARHRAGRFRQIGDGTNTCGLTYVDNAAAAHVQALDALSPASANAGKAYFVTDPEPVELWPWLNAFLTGVGAPPLTRSVSLGTATTVGSLLETAWTWLPLGGEPPLTRFAALNLGTSHWYDLSAARRDFGLRAVVPGDEGLARTIAWFREHPEASVA